MASEWVFQRADSSTGVLLLLALLAAALTLRGPDAAGSGAVLQVSVAPPAAAAAAMAYSAPQLQHNVLVVSQFDEDVTWALELVAPNGLLEGRWNLVVYCKQPAEADKLDAAVLERGLVRAVSIVREPENWGYEAGSYLRFITAHYDSLPPLMFFTHGAPFSHTPYLRDMLACANPDFDKYFGAGKDFWEVHEMVREISAFTALRARYTSELETSAGPFVATQHALAPIVGGNIAVYASAQFLVARAAVLRRPLPVWRAIFAAVFGERGPFPRSTDYYYDNTVNDYPRKAGAFMLEILWPELLAGRRREEWRTYEETCGEAGDTATPLLASCCGTHRISNATSSSPCSYWKFTDDRMSTSICH